MYNTEIRYIFFVIMFLFLLSFCSFSLNPMKYTEQVWTDFYMDLDKNEYKYFLEEAKNRQRQSSLSYDERVAFLV